MNYAFLLILLPLAYFVILHVRWRKKIKSYMKTIQEEKEHIVHLEKMASLGTLSAGVAHEINNPLTFLITNLNFLQKSAQKGTIGTKRIEDTREILEECLNGASRIKKIVKDLLSFSRQSKGQASLTDLNELLDASIRILWNEIKYKVDIVKDYKLQSKTWIDANQISQVFLNIILNGVRAISGKGAVSSLQEEALVKNEKGTITISTAEEGDTLIVAISDTGCGIPKEKIGKIFEPFYTTKGGTGLGLYITNSIVEKNGGKIEVKSELNKGTTLTVLLPKKMD